MINSSINRAPTVSPSWVSSPGRYGTAVLLTLGLGCEVGRGGNWYHINLRLLIQKKTPQPCLVNYRFLTGHVSRSEPPPPPNSRRPIAGPWVIKGASRASAHDNSANARALCATAARDDDAPKMSASAMGAFRAKRRRRFFSD